MKKEEIIKLIQEMIGEQKLGYSNPTQSGGGTWGSITGTLSNQSDLNTSLNSKANSSDLNSYVPYSGATTNVDLGTRTLSTAAVNSIGVNGSQTDIAQPYSNTFYKLLGKATGTGSAIQIKKGTTATTVEGDDLEANYSDNVTTKISAVDAKYGFFYQRKGTIQTSGTAAWTAIIGSNAVLTTETGKVYQVHASVVGRNGTTAYAGGDIYATVKNVGGTASIVGTVQRVAQNQSDGTWGSTGNMIDITFSGADVRVSVYGKTGVTIDWKMLMDYIAY